MRSERGSVVPSPQEGDLVLLDGHGNDEEVLAVLRRLLDDNPHRPVVLILPPGKDGLAVEAFRAGVSDCLLRDHINRSSLERAISHAVYKAEMSRQLQIRERLLDSVDEGVITVDCEHTVTTINLAARRLLEVPAEAVVGKRCCEVFAHSICRGSCAFARAVNDGASSDERVIQGRSPSGELWTWSAKAVPLRDARGRQTGALIVLRDMSDIAALRARAREMHEFEGMVSKSPAMHAIFASLPAIADSDSTVLIEGPSGSGKEVLARALHARSRRHDGPFVAVNCAALPDSLLESELFGYRAGAFTGARTDRPGRFAAAAGGTLFLDEIGDISPSMQTRLLRVLQEKTYEPLGSVEPVRADVRILAATNQDLEQAIEEGRFRKDLYYRLRVLHVLLPPLEDRREDIPLLAQRFLEQCCAEQRRSVQGFRERVMVRLIEHDYPGNTRELRNIVEHSVALCDEELIDIQHLPSYLNGDLVVSSSQRSPSSLRELERTYIEELLRKHRGNRSAVARELGVHLSTFYRKCERLRIDLPDRDGRHRPS